MKPHCQHRHIGLIDDVHAPAGLIHGALTYNRLFHGFRQGVPGAQVHPAAGKAHHLDIGLVLHHRVVKGDFGQGFVLVVQILIVRKINEFVGPVQHIPELIGKHAAIPQSALGDVALGNRRGGLFLEGADPGNRPFPLREDIAVLFAGIGGLNAHQHQIGFSFVRLSGKIFECLKIVVIHIGIHRADHHGFVRGNPHHIHKIAGCQGNGREGIPAAGLHGNAHFVSQLIVNQRNLGLGGGNGHLCLGVRTLDLAEDPLNHGFVARFPILENLDELLGANVITQGPQPLAGAAGQQYQIHTFSFTVPPAWGCAKNPRRTGECPLPARSCRSSPGPSPWKHPAAFWGFRWAYLYPT